jgi:hypothetical protein
MAAQAFLQKALMPLHKPKGLGMYQQQLSYCVTQVHTSHPTPRPAAPCWAVFDMRKGRGTCQI